MKLKFTIVLIFTFKLLFAQNYYFPNTILNDSVLLSNKLKQIVAIQNKKYIVKNNIDSLKTLIKQQIFLDDYTKAISTIQNYRNELAINNWENNKLFSFEIFSETKIVEINKKITFDIALDIVLKEKLENLPEKLLINLKKEINVNIANYEKQRNEIIEAQKNKDSISNSDVNSLLESTINSKVFKLVNKKALTIFEKVIFKKFINEMVEVKTTTGATLSMTITRRKNQKLPLPVILTNNIYAGDKDLVTGMRAAVRDYVGVIVNTRGKRNSKDIIEPFEHESKDLYDIIDWISKQKWCNGKVGMIGGSYLGFSQWATTKKLHPALKTIAPQAAVGIGTMDFPMVNNVFSSYMIRWLSYVTNNNLIDQVDFDNNAKWNSIYNEYYTKGKKFNTLDSINGKENTIFQRWLNHPSQDNYWQRMIPYKEDFSKINIPILSTTGYYDADQRGVLYYFNQHYKYNKTAEHYLIIGPYEHQSVQSFPGNYLNNEKLDNVAKINFTDLNFDWFDYVLKGKDKPSILQDKVNVQIMGTNQWKHFGAMKNSSKNNLKFYLDKNKTSNSIFVKPLKNDIITQIVDFKIRNEKKKYYSTAKDSMSIGNARIVIESEVLDKDIIINGLFTGNLRFLTNKKDLDISIDLIEVKSNGEIFYLADYLGRASYAKDKTKRQLLKPNTIVHIPISNSSFISKKIEKGSKLVVVFGVNKNKFWQINYGTGKDVSDESMKDAVEPLEIKWYNDSYIEIPILE